MGRLIKWFNIIIKKQKGAKRWQKVVTVMAAMITFATTYALILPAITVEKNSIEEVGGMYLEQTAEQDELLEENALEPNGVSIAADMDNAVTFSYADDDLTATAVFSTDEIIPEGTELVVSIVDPASEEYAALRGRSEGLLDKEFIYDVTTCSFYDFALVCDNVDVTPKTGMVDIQIIFRNNTNQHVNDVVYVGRFARPSEDSDGFAAMAVSTVEAGVEADDAVSVNGTAVNDNSAGESGNPSVGEDELVSLNIDESSAIELSDGIITSLSLKGSDLSRSDSLVGIIAGYVDEEIKAAAAETDAEIPEYDESQDEDEQRSSGEDASANADNNVSTSPEEDSSGTSAEDERKEITDALQMKTLKASGRDYTVTLTYDESSKIPEGASLTVSEISKDSKEYQTYLEETKKAMGLKEEETLPGFAARFFDIKIMVGGKEFNPESGVSVEITYAEPLAEYSDTEVNAVHFADEKAEAEMIEANTAEVQDDGKATVEFTAESFSVYGVIYTVDFHYEINGKTVDFSIPGGGFVSLEHIVEVLGIATGGEDSENGAENAKNGAENEDEFEGEVLAVDASGENEEGSVEEGVSTENNASAACEETIKLNEIKVSEVTKKFVTDVESVEFSNPELVWVGKVEKETTVRELKESNELEVLYSGELSVKDISKINALTVEAGDWALISVQPFEDEQTLILTMKDGEKFTIQLTGQAHSDDVCVQYSSADGDTVVTACAPVGTLPEGTKIQIREIDPYTDFSENIEEEAKLYTEARGAVANKLWQERRTLDDAKVVDITFIDIDGNEIEPESNVDVSVILAEALKTADGEKLGLAHIPGGEETDIEFLEADIDGCETVFTSDAFSIYVIFNGSSPSTGENEPVVFDKGWIRFGGNMQKRTELPDGYFNYYIGDYASTEGAWKWLTVELYELKSGVSEDGYTDHNNYNKISEYKYLAGDTDIVVEDYDFNGRNVLCAVFTDRYFEPGEGETSWQFVDAKNGADIRKNYGGIALAHSRRYHDYVGWIGQWDVDDPACLRVYLSHEQEVTRVPHTDYIVRYYHPDGTFDAFSGSLENGSSDLTFSYGDKIRVSEEDYSGLAVAAGHDAITSISTTNGTATIRYSADVPIVKLNFYYKEKIDVKTGGTVSGQPVYDTIIDENGKKIYDTHNIGLHTDKTATLVTDSDNPTYNDGRTFNLTLESWNVGESGADIGMVLDASGSMTWSSTVATPVPVSDETIRKYNLPTSTNGLSNWLTLTQVNDILDKTRTDSSQMGYNGYTYYIQDAANGDEFVPLGYYDSDTQSNSTLTNGYYQTSNNITFAKKNSPDSGWYYVNTSNARNYKNGSPKQYANWANATDSGYLWLRNTTTGAEYRTNTQVSNDSNGTGTSFYIKDGELWAVWTRGTSNNVSKVYQSRVFMKPKDGVVKDESLQHAIARFTAILNAQSPQSQIAMTRFSRNGTGGGVTEDGFSNGQLALLNWQNDSITITAALNQLYGTPSTTSNVSQTDSDNGNPLSVYNYSFTGQTSTKRGIDAFMAQLTKGGNNNNKYNPKATHSNNSKYLIVFTDGKDTDTSDWVYNETSKTITSYTSGSALDKAKTLKQNDYTIFTVLMRSGSMSDDDVDRASAFLKEMSGTKNSTAAEKDSFFFDIAFDDANALAAAFEEIAKEIAKPLDGYMVRDYIDPRFDLIDADGNIRTRLDSYGSFLPVVITLSDGKRALLKYDSDKMMFYIEVENQSVPTSPQNSTQVTVNSVQLTVRAKDDFIGGNDMLTNGNDSELNQVFKPAEGYNIAANNPTAADPDTTNYPKKDYPKTTTNPASYGTTLLNYEDTIFLNETISPIDLFGQVSTMDDETADDNHLNVYAGYLSRAGKKLHDDENYYINILQNGTLPGGHQNVNGEVITITDKIITIKLPYYYLKDENNIRSYAGGDLHQGDKVGTITYTWKAIDTGGHTLTDNNAFKDYMSTTLDTVKYQLSMSYTPDPVVANDNIANNGSARTLALTNQTGNDKLIRDPVGNVAESQSTDTTDEGFAVVHVVAGKIGITKKISKQDLDDKGITVNDLPTVTFTITKDGTAYKTVTAAMSQSTLSNGYYELTVWETDLPKGTYTVSETTGDGYKLDSFDAVTVQDDSSTTTVNEAQFAAKYTKDSNAMTVTWYIGPKEEAADRQPDVSTYPDCVNGTTLFPYDMVADNVYHVDPNLAADNGKYYLNGQIGQAVYINKLNPLVMLRKADMTNSSKPVNGAEFSFYKEVEAGTAGALTDVIAGKSVKAVSEVTSGEYVQEQGADQGAKLAGYVSLGDLDTDGTYYLVEDNVPSGYIMPEWKYVKITLTAAQISWSAYKEDGSIYGSPQSAAKETVDGKKCYTVTILNNPGASLPSTGGPGTTFIYILGTMLTGLAGTILALRRKRRAA